MSRKKTKNIYVKYWTERQGKKVEQIPNFQCKSQW